MDTPITTWVQVARVLAVSTDTVHRHRRAEGTPHDYRRPWFASEAEVVAWWKTLHGCYVCGVSARLDEHHLAPRAVFGDNADRWPVVDVCHDCHREWHRLMTDHWMLSKRP